MSERAVVSKFLIEASKIGARMFRNNSAQGWAGKSQRFSESSIVPVSPGDVIIRKANPLHAGLCKGSSDTVGYKSITITPEMVGEKIAVFTAVEIKTGNLKPTEEQMNFISAVKEAGGRATVAWTVEEGLRVFD